jgi:RNA polymerase sigma factor (sigma-70 family)
MASRQSWTSAELLSRVRAGEEAAAEEIFERYLERLTALARTRLSPRLASRLDPEDVVLSAWRSFFVGARQDRFALRRSGDLWRLLVSITMHKLHHQVRRHSAEVRSTSREQSITPDAQEEFVFEDHEPTPDEAITLADVLESCLTELDSFGRGVLERRLQGEQLEAIAAETGRSERTIRRTLAQIRELLARGLERDSHGRPL